MKARHTDFEGECGEPTTCDFCKKKIDEGWMVSPETNEEFDKVASITEGQPILVVCEDCLYENFSKKTTQIYSCKGTRLRECEQNLNGTKF
jgi:ferredoxin